jgi:hypothetical protein
MRPRFRLRQHLTVRSVRREGTDVHVVATDPSGAAQRINWVFDDEQVAEQRYRVVERWRRAATRLTYVGGDGETALVDDALLFRAAYRGPSLLR